MSRSLILSFHSASRKYFQLKRKVKKSISRGEFWRFTRHKRSHLLQKIERLRRRLAELRTQIRIATAGAATAVLLMAGQASAQNTSESSLGPFNPSPLKNPFPPPAFLRADYVTVAYADMDGDGDLDAVQSSEDHQLHYFENQGNAQKPYFKRITEGVFENVSLYAGAFENRTRVTFDDIDDDGDMDMLIGQDDTDGVFGTPDRLFFYRNDKGPNMRPHFVDPAEHDPFDGIEISANAWPLFADVDNDGDKDLIVGGFYFVPLDDNYAWVQYYRNDKNGNAFDVDPVYTHVPYPNNPFYVDEFNASGYFSPAFEDMDEDGDVDFIYSTDDGDIQYRRNDNGTFVQQTGPWVYNAGNPGASTGNPFSSLPIFGTGDYVGISFGDLDGDGDQDLTTGFHIEPESSQASIQYFENTGHGVMAANWELDNPVTGTDFGDHAGITTVDYDNDGDLDLLGTGTENGQLNYLIIRNDGQGAYVPLLFEPGPFGDIHALDGRITFADVDGDSDLDIVITHFYDADDYYAPYYYENDGGTYIKHTGESNPLDFLGQYSEVDFADLDGDGLTDMVMWQVDQRLKIFRNTGEVGSPLFIQEPTWENGILYSLYNSVHPKFIDLDNDGDMDIVVGKYENMWYYENEGSSTFPSWKQYVNKDYAVGNPTLDRTSNPFTDIVDIYDPNPTLADMDGDGDRDLVIGTGYGQFTYYENQNPAPTVVQKRTSIPFVPGQTIVLDPEMELSDTDDDKISSIRVTITPYSPGMERLDLSDAPAGLGSNWDNVKGELTIFGAADITAYQAALRQIFYISDPDFIGQRSGDKNSRSFVKTIQVKALDADLTEAPSNTRQFSIAHTNEVPAVTPVTFNVTYTNAPLPVISTINITDDDDGNLESAEVAFTSGTYRPAEDRLAVSGSFPTTITEEYDAVNGIMYLTGVAPVADYQAALRLIVYNNQFGASGNATARTLRVKVYDGESDSNLGQINLSLFSANNPPALAPVTNAVPYTGGNVAIHPAVTITDDGSTITAASIMFTNGFVFGEDKLLFTNQSGITGTFNDTTAVLSLAGSATLANYQAALRSIQYTNVATTRTSGPRVVAFTVSDGSFSSNVSNVSVTVANTPPTISGTAANFWATGAVVVNNNIVLNDTDDTMLQGATVTISSGFNVAEDQLLFTNQNGITGTTTTGSPTLTLTGASSVANYQAALRSVRYQNSSTNPSTTDRGFTFTITDGGTTTTLTGSIVVINKPPVITLPELITRAGGNIALVITETFTDPDDNLDLSTISVTSARNAGITVNSEIIVVDYSSQDTFKGTDNVTISVCDTGGRCTSIEASVEVGAAPRVFTGMSPNGDGINDWFHIDFLPPGSEVAIYNRWGEAIFETNDYDVTDPAKRFEGKNQNGTDVIAGSYFYKVRYKDQNDTIVKTGTILLNR